MDAEDADGDALDFTAYFQGEAVPATRDELKLTGWSWPHAFVKTALTAQRFAEVGGSNHLHSVRGDYLPEMEDLCRLFEIPCRVFRMGEGALP